MTTAVTEADWEAGQRRVDEARREGLAATKLVIVVEATIHSFFVFVKAGSDGTTGSTSTREMGGSASTAPLERLWSSTSALRARSRVRF